MASTRSQPTDEERLAREVFVRLGASADESEAYAHPHAARIAALADACAKLFNLGRADRASLRVAALAHALGLAAMKRDYLSRAGALGEEERLDLARHPVIGEQEAARAGADRAAQLIVRWSHEWWNGCGYPDALRREQIPLAARILRVADAYCALTDDRPFRRAGTEEEARRHLAQWAGIEFDPRVVHAFLSLHGLPELRSFARREDEARADDSQASRDAATGEEVAAHGEATTHATAAAAEDDEPRTGRAPEAGADIYAATGDDSAAVEASGEAAAKHDDEQSV
ncbi:MAG: HD domain-containing protein [Acidobacteria bacterium]|nr:HD domain-containing protein [Acidobacteriota bacterium]